MDPNFSNDIYFFIFSLTSVTKPHHERVTPIAGTHIGNHTGHGVEILGEDIHDLVVEAGIQEDDKGLYLEKSHRATIIAAIVKKGQEVVKGDTDIEPVVDLIQMNDTQGDDSIVVSLTHLLEEIARPTRGAGQKLGEGGSLGANGRDTGTVAVKTVRVDQTESWRRPTNVPREVLLNNSLESMTSYLSRIKTSSICSC